MKTIAVVGLGSIGKRHITNLLALGYQRIVGVDMNKYHDEVRVPTVARLADAVAGWQVSHAIVCTPPEVNRDIATFFIKHGVRTFVEKPLTATYQDAFTVSTIDPHIAVGYMERANPTVIAARDFVTQNQIKNAYLELYWKMTPKTYKQDFLLESSHIFDAARFILGEMHVVHCAVTDSWAEIKLAHNGGYTHLTINADALPMRRINLYAHNGERFGRQYGLELNEWDECYRKELEAFLDGAPLCTGKEAAKVLELIEQVKR